MDPNLPLEAYGNMFGRPASPEPAEPAHPPEYYQERVLNNGTTHVSEYESDWRARQEAKEREAYWARIVEQQEQEAEEAQEAEAARKANEERQAEAARKATEERQAKEAEAARQAEIARKANAERQAKEAEAARQVKREKEEKSFRNLVNEYILKMKELKEKENISGIRGILKEMETLQKTPVAKRLGYFVDPYHYEFYSGFPKRTGPVRTIKQKGRKRKSTRKSRRTFF